eukprot:UN08609
MKVLIPETKVDDWVTSVINTNNPFLHVSALLRYILPTHPQIKKLLQPNTTQLTDQEVEDVLGQYLNHQPNDVDTEKILQAQFFEWICSRILKVLIVLYVELEPYLPPFAFALKYLHLDKKLEDAAIQRGIPPSQ